MKIFVSKFEGWKGRPFYGRPRAALNLATPLANSTPQGEMVLSSTALQKIFYIMHANLNMQKTQFGKIHQMLNLEQTVL